MTEMSQLIVFFAGLRLCMEKIPGNGDVAMETKNTH